MTTSTQASSRALGGVWHLVTRRLGVKILLLVLAPLLLTAIGLLTLMDVEQRQITDTQIAEEKARMIELRQRAVRSNVELVASMVRKIAERAPDTQTARRRALALIRDMRFDDDNYVFAYREDGTMLAQAGNPALEGTNVIDETDANGKPLIRDMLDIAREGGGYYRYEWRHPETGEVVPKYSYAAGIPEWDWVIGAGVYVTDIEAGLADITATAHRRVDDAFAFLLLIGGLGILLIGALSVLATRRIVRPIHHTALDIGRIAGEVADGRGDLTQRLTVHGRDEIGELGEQFNAFMARMQETLRDVQGGAGDVNRAAQDIARSSQELAARTDQAAASLQQTSSAMEEITSTVETNAEHTRQANRLVQSTSEVAQQGQAAMGDAERTMQDIKASAERIGDIVTMIDSIAFQTNILALNASVEAARAGEHGRGFAVVAQEVRKLAQDSANAAQEIKGLIEDSTEHTRQGAEIVHRAGERMREIHESVEQVTAVIAEISAGSSQQSAGVGEVNTAVNQLDTMTQQNAVMVQETANTSTQMRQQAEHLDALIGAFRLGDAPREAAPSLPTSRPAASRHPIPVVSSQPEWEAF